MCDIKTWCFLFYSCGPSFISSCPHCLTPMMSSMSGSQRILKAMLKDNQALMKVSRYEKNWQSDRVCHSGGRYRKYYPGDLSSCHCNSCECRVSVDFMCRYLTIKRIAVTWQGIEGTRIVVPTMTTSWHALLLETCKSHGVPMFSIITAVILLLTHCDLATP